MKFTDRPVVLRLAILAALAGGAVEWVALVRARLADRRRRGFGLVSRRPA